MRYHQLLPFHRLLALGCLAAGALACSEATPTAPMDSGIVMAKGGGGGAGPRVTGAVPNEAPQGVSLRVAVEGGGFDSGSQAEFLLSGVNTGKVRVDSSKYVSDRQLDAYVTIEAEADVALYDVAVTTSGGKKGIGSELFAVKETGAPVDTPVIATFRDAAGDGVLGDAPAPYDAVILDIGNLMLDARVGVARKICLAFAGQGGAPLDVCDDAYLTTASPDVTGGLLAMAPGTSMTTRGQVTWVKQDVDGKGYNWFLRFGMDCQSEDDAANRLSVTRSLDGASWSVEGSVAMLCRLPTKGKPQMELVGSFTMPFGLALTL